MVPDPQLQPWVFGNPSYDHFRQRWHDIYGFGVRRHHIHGPSDGQAYHFLRHQADQQLAVPGLHQFAEQHERDPHAECRRDLSLVGEPHRRSATSGGGQAQRVQGCPAEADRQRTSVEDGESTWFPDWQRCVNSEKAYSPEIAIGACTALIDSGRETAQNRAAAYSNRGVARAAKKDHDRAIADYNKAIEIDPRHPNAYNNRGNAYADKHDYDRAFADYTKQIEIDPRHAHAYRNRGLVHYRRNELDQAIADHTRAVEIDPRYADAYDDRADAYRGKGEHDRAIADYTRAIEIDPRHANAYNGRGTVHAAKNDHDRAIADYTKQIEIEPRHTHAYINRGNAHAAKKDYDRAIADYTKQIEIDPRHMYAYGDRGISHAAKKDHDGAIADYTKAIEIDPQDASRHSRRGLARFDSGDFRGASLDMLRTIELRDDAYAMLLRYLALARSGDAGARADLEANASRLKDRAWPYAVTELFAGKRSSEATLSAAAGPENTCEAHFYIGEWLLLQGDRSAAARSLQTAVDTCPVTFVEHASAEAELRRLGQ